MKTLNELKELLLKGQQLSMQGSLDRRMPAKESIPYLLDARKGLKQYVLLNPDDYSAWKLLSQAEETLLNYPAALSALENSLKSGAKDRKDLKRLALLHEYLLTWKELNLTPEQLSSLGEYLEIKLDQCNCNHTLSFTKEWLDNNVAKNKKSKIIKTLQAQGGFCDCEVLTNVVI